jgi:hypothetical protein
MRSSCPIPVAVTLSDIANSPSLHRDAMSVRLPNRTVCHSRGPRLV